MIMTLECRKRIVVSEEVMYKWKKMIGEYSILYFSAVCGFGKTTQAMAFAQNYVTKWDYVSVTEDDFFEKIDRYYEEKGNTRYHNLLIIDDLQCLMDREGQQRLKKYLVEYATLKNKMRVILISRADVPTYLTSLLATKQMITVRETDIALGVEQVKELIEMDPESKSLPEELIITISKKMGRITRGHPVAMMLYYRQALEFPYDSDATFETSKERLCDYLEDRILSSWWPEMVTAVKKLSIFSTFNKAMVKAVLGNDADDCMAYFQQIGSFLHPCSMGYYEMEPIFRLRMNKRFSEWPDEEQKEIYSLAGKACEQERDYKQAMYCYRQADNTEKIIELFIYLSEHSDGNSYARIIAEYVDDISIDMEQNNPRLLGAKAMLYAYQMKKDKSLSYIEKMKQIIEEEKGSELGRLTMNEYMRMILSNPCISAKKLRENIPMILQYSMEFKLDIKFINPSGNTPSVLHGALDLLDWEPYMDDLYGKTKLLAQKSKLDIVHGSSDVLMGEFAYEHNHRTEALNWLSKVYGEASVDKCIYLQYAAAGSIIKCMIAEKQMDAAEKILLSMMNAAIEDNLKELIPNMEASRIYFALYRNDITECNQWLNTVTVNEYVSFYASFRYQLLIKARVYLALNRELESMHVLLLLEQYADVYNREYLRIEIGLLKSIIYYRRKEAWQETMKAAVKQAAAYGLIRIIADQGAPLWPLWKKIDWQKEPYMDEDYRKAVEQELRLMTEMYPDYMVLQPVRDLLTEKERIVLELMAEGLSNAKIADKLGVSLGTAKFHVSNVINKLRAGNRTVAVKIAQRDKII